MINQNINGEITLVSIRYTIERLLNEEIVGWRAYEFKVIWFKEGSGEKKEEIKLFDIGLW